MALPSQGESTRGYTLFEEGSCLLFKSPSTLDNGCTQPGANIKGEIGFVATIAKKRVSSPKSVYSKKCISDSQGTWTLGFCMEATQSL